MSADDEAEARERLLFHLENQTGFWFALVVGDDVPPRARFREAAEAWCRGNSRPFFLHEPDPEGLVKLAVTLAKGDSPGIHWIRADGATGLSESWNAGAAQMLMAMNERREAYRKRLEGGIVVEGRSSLKRILREMAPDMFSIRAFIAEPGEEPRRRASDPPEWRPPVGLASLSGFGPDAEQALQQLARLETFVGTGRAGDRIQALLLAAVSLANAGQYDEAEHRARELLSEIERDADNIVEANPAQAVYGLLGVVATARGNDVDAVAHFDRAIDFLRSCPVRDEDDRRLRGLALFILSKQRALTLFRSGDLDAAREALEVHSDFLTRVPDDKLPPEVQLDLLDTYLGLGEVLHQQGKPEEAERSLRTAVLLAEKKLAEDPKEERWQLELVRARLALGRTMLARNDAAGAIEVLRPAAEAVKHLESVERTKGHWGQSFEDVHVLLSLALSSQRDFSEAAVPVHQRAFVYLKSRFERAPEEIGLGWLLARAWLGRAVILKDAGDATGTQDAVRQAVELAERLPIQDDEQAQLSKTIESMRTFFGKKRTRHRPAKRS